MRPLPLGAALTILLAPVASGQTAVDACERQCRPTDPDVNDPAVRSAGPSNLILYAHPGAGPWMPYFLDTNAQLPDTIHEVEVVSNELFPRLITTTGTPLDVNFDRAEARMNLIGSLIDLANETRFAHRLPWAKDILLGPGPIVLYVYASVDAVPPEPEAGAAPDVRVRATWTAGDASEPFAVGEAGPFRLTRLPGQPRLFEIPVTLTVDQPSIPACTETPQCMLRIRFDQIHNDAANVVQREVRLVMGPQTPWRLVVPMAHPLEGRGTIWSIQDDVVHVAWDIESPLGAYDVDAESVRLTFPAMDGEEPTALPPREIRFRLEHSGVAMPSRAYWAISRQQLQGAPTIHLSALNLQQTFQVETTVPIPADVQDGGATVPAPGFLAAWLVTLSMVLVQLGRRRRHSSPDVFERSV